MDVTAHPNRRQLNAQRHTTDKLADLRDGLEVFGRDFKTRTHLAGSLLKKLNAAACQGSFWGIRPDAQHVFWGCLHPVYREDLFL